MVKFLTNTVLLEDYCKATGKYGMFINIGDWRTDEELKEIFKAAPYLDSENSNDFLNYISQILCDGQGFIICDTRAEMERYYDLTVGDDGPTALNDYSGPCKIYALTCSPENGLENENT
jgi:hypothetical protein